MKKLLPLAVMAAVTAAAIVLACSDESNPTPSVVLPPGPTADTGTLTPEASTCASDAATCNSCITPESDPYNACSSAAGGCVPFDNEARVPKGPNGGLPQVP